MSHITTSFNHGIPLRTILLVDAATCVLMGIALVVAAAPLARLLSLPAALLEYAGAGLVPIAGFVAWVATRTVPHVTGTWITIACNTAWVVGSLALLVAGWVSPSVLGHIFVIAQAVAVVGLGVLEYRALRSSLA